MKIDFVASLPHYRDHMLPIFNCLPAAMQGTVHPLGDVRPPPSHHVVMVGGWQDVQVLQGRARMIYVEHGAGQAYLGEEGSARNPGWSGSGGDRHFGVVGFIAPSETVAKRWRTAPAVAVGCPKMDEYVGLEPSGEPSVCFAWHWEALVCPEARTALPHYQNHFIDIIRRFERQGFKVYGHAHPRWERALDPMMAAMGLEQLHTDREVFERCSVLFVDNSSIGVEFMSLGRPVVWLNAPWYRRDVHHTGRFWEWTEGIPTMDGPDELMELWVSDVMYGDDNTTARQRIVDSVYAHTDGSSSQRAADFIAQLVGR